MARIDKKALAVAKAYALGLDTVNTAATEESAAIAAAKLECLQSLASDATLGTYVDLADLATGVEEVAELQITHVPDAAGNVTVTVDGTGTPVAVVIGVADVCSLTINEAAGVGGTGVVTLAGTETNITVEIGDAASVAAAIVGTYAADETWTVTRDGAVVTFTAKAAGAKTGAFTWSAGDTGAVSTLGIVHSVAGVTADTVDSVAAKIETAYSGNANWTAVAATDTVTFTAKAIGVKTDITYSAGTTGCTGTVTVTAQGKAIADQTKIYKTADDKYAYWSGSSWAAGDTAPSTIASQLAATLKKVTLTAAQYAALETPDPLTMYEISDEPSAPVYAPMFFANKEVLTTDWVDDTTYSGYTKKAVITCTGVTTDWFVEVVPSGADQLLADLYPEPTIGTNSVTIYIKAARASTLTIPTIKAVRM